MFRSRDEVPMPENITILPHCTESLKHDSIETFHLYNCRWKISVEFQLPTVIQS